MKIAQRIARIVGGVGVVLGGTVFQGCPASGLLNECFGDGTISASEYEDLNGFEQLLYDETGCGRYEERFDF